MKYRKTYKVRAAMGDGRPIDDVITAKNGTEAHDLTKAKYPAARAIYILGLAEEQLALDHPFFSDKDEVEVVLTPKVEKSDQELKVDQCVALRSQGKSYAEIAGVIGIGSTTVRRWLKKHG